MMELFIPSSLSENRDTSRRNRNGWVRNDRPMLLYIVLWLSIIAIALAL
jgi:hypothetical protein